MSPRTPSRNSTPPCLRLEPQNTRLPPRGPDQVPLPSVPRRRSRLGGPQRRPKVLSSDQKQLHIAARSVPLFNSSVVPHKNLLFALRAFMESGIERLGVHFCITGQPQHDAYSRAVTDLVSKHKSVIFTGYVDEATKRHLYLNALALISPSLVEGFGIPVLDAACLGLTTLASPISSHREIRECDFRGARAAVLHSAHQRLG